MVLKYCGRSAGSILAGLLIFATPYAQAGGSLAGSKGHVRYAVFFPLASTGGCSGGYKDYIAASGHSAYASTPSTPMTEFTLCGISINAKSQQAAEDSALRGCQNGLKKYKFETSGACSIAASK
jgi:hypothetical protein